MKRLPLILLLVAAAAFGFGLLHLFQLRFEAGDVYPKYSSLRADPLGTKAFYESLHRLLSVRRNFQASLKLGEGRDTTLFVLGLEPRELRADPEELKQLEGFVADGGRMVIALFPHFQKPTVSWYERARPSKGTNTPPAKTGQKPSRPTRKVPFKGEDDSVEPGQILLGERWKFDVTHGVAPKDEKGVYEPVIVQRKGAAPLPESLEWHSAVWFDKPDSAWRVIYAREKDRAVAMERPLGSGSIVLLTDSFHFSNESLRWGRQAGLLAWLVGPNRRVIFDEAHLGVAEDPGVATLARQYRLHGVFVALLMLAALFIWKNSASFMPPYADELARESGDPVLGKESAAGFVNLLRRNIRASEVLPTCLAEWKKSCGRAVTAGKLQQVEAVIEAETNSPPGKRKPVIAYRTISGILAKPTFTP